MSDVYAADLKKEFIPPLATRNALFAVSRYNRQQIFPNAG
jgi:hypothetical protein